MQVHVSYKQLQAPAPAQILSDKVRKLDNVRQESPMHVLIKFPGMHFTTVSTSWQASKHRNTDAFGISNCSWSLVKDQTSSTRNTKQVEFDGLICASCKFIAKSDILSPPSH